MSTTTALVCADCRKPVERTFDDDFQHVTLADGVACTVYPVRPVRAESGEADGGTSWNRLREAVRSERDTRREIAGQRIEEGRESQAERLTKYADGLDWVLATMERMEAGQ